jgi:TRAP-type C4-dicarboxylate transport system permease large subunit
MNALLKDVGLAAIFRGCTIFCVPLVLGLVLVMLFPQLALWLPSLMR